MPRDIASDEEIEAIRRRLDATPELKDWMFDYRVGEVRRIINRLTDIENQLDEYAEQDTD